MPQSGQQLLLNIDKALCSILSIGKIKNQLEILLTTVSLASALMNSIEWDGVSPRTFSFNKLIGDVEHSIGYQCSQTWVCIPLPSKPSQNLGQQALTAGFPNLKNQAILFPVDANTTGSHTWFSGNYCRNKKESSIVTYIKISLWISRRLYSCKPFGSLVQCP